MQKHVEFTVFQPQTRKPVYPLVLSVTEGNIRKLLECEWNALSVQA